MYRQLLAFTLAVSGFISSAGPASAQVWIQPYPYTPSLWYAPPINPNARTYGGFPYLGTLPNGTTVFNPWGPRYFNNGFYPGYYKPYYSASVRFQYSYNFGPYGNYTAAGSVGYGATNVVGIERELGRFVPVARDTAVNPITGTVLRPWSGVAYTNEGPFYRLPGTGSITAWGAYIPGSGAYFNPINGALYNPSTGLIVRR